MKKIIFLSTFALDANLSIIKELSLKYDVYFITEALHKKYNYLDPSKLDALVSNGTEVTELQPFSEMVDLSKVFVIHGIRQRHIIRKLYNSYIINRLVQKINPDVIMTDTFTMTYIFSQIKYRSHTLLIVHDPFLHSGEYSVSVVLMRKFLFKIIPYKLLFNDAQRKDFCKYYKQKEINVFSSFLSTYEYLTYFKPNNIKKKDDSFEILFFGRISPYKGIKYLLDAVVLLIKKGYKNIHVTIAGSGTFDFDIHPYFKYKQVSFINRYIEPNELAGFITNSSIVVCPYTDATQSGVIMSAFAFGKPVIATNVGGLPDMVKNNHTGIIVPTKNPVQLSDAIERLINNPSTLETMHNNILGDYHDGGVMGWRKAVDHITNAINYILSR